MRRRETTERRRADPRAPAQRPPRAAPDDSQVAGDRSGGAAARLRAALEHRGPAYVKLGQFLALHPDLIPRAYCDELGRLVDRAPPIAAEQALAIIAGDLGGDVDTAFARIEPGPIWSGLLAQAHLAELRDGARVAIKVQRPAAVALAMKTLGSPRKLARLLRHGGLKLAIDGGELLARLERWLSAEADAERELEHASELHRLALDDELVVIPRPYAELSGPRTVCVEHLAGIRVVRLLGPRRSPAAPLAHRLGLEEAGESLLLAVLTQVFHHRRVVLDLLPANLVALPAGEIAFADFGHCEQIEDTWRPQRVRLLAALCQRDVHPAFAALDELFVTPDDLNLARFRQALVRRARRWPIVEDSPGSPLAGLLHEVLELAAQHDLKLPPPELATLRALATADAVACELASGRDLRAITAQFLLGLRRRTIARRFERADLEALGVNALTILRESPRQLQHLLLEIDEGQFELPVYARELPAAASARRRRVRVVVAAVATVGLAALLAMGPSRDALLTAPLAALLVAAYATVAVGWWRLRERRPRAAPAESAVSIGSSRRWRPR